MKQVGLSYIEILLSLSNEKVIEFFFIHGMKVNNCIKQT